MARLCPLLAFCRQGEDTGTGSSRRDVSGTPSTPGCYLPIPNPTGAGLATHGHPTPFPALLTSFCTSLLMAEIFIFMSSSSWSGMTCTCGQCSDSSGEGNTRSARGTYHLQSYCWCFLRTRRGC